jgi:hypothetical protein
MNPRTLIPNAETQRAIADGCARKGVTVHKSIASFRKSLQSKPKLGVAKRGHH